MDDVRVRLLAALQVAGEKICNDYKVEATAKEADAKLGEKITELPKELFENAKLIINMIKDTSQGYYSLPMPTLFACAGAILYFVTPVDVWSDFLPGGHIDDAAVVGVVICAFQSDFKAYKDWKANESKHISLNSYLDEKIGPDESLREAEIARLATLCTDSSLTDMRERAMYTLRDIEG